MNISMKWLRDYVDIGDVSLKEFSSAMTMSGSKVECFETEGHNIDRVVVGQVKELVRHPDADKLWVCQIDVGEETVQIVTGAQNLTVGDYIPVALDNSTLPDKKIKKGKLRGVESAGMLCSFSELGLTQNDFPTVFADGIFLLDEECDRTLGIDICESVGLNDDKVEFEITSNRPDCMSMVGIAREASATFNKPLTVKESAFKGVDGSIADFLQSVTIEDSDLCSRYCAAVVKNVRIKPSPRWLRERLRACGVRPINNIVDITNYVMLEYGHPMHAFDLRCLTGSKIVVRRAKEQEEITTLDDIERPLTTDMLVIADAEKPVAAAGIMGGEFSGISDDTQTIVFEAACFDGPSIRVTAKKLGLRTDSSARFEKGLDNTACLKILNRACELVELLEAGDVIRETVDCCPTPKAPVTIPLESAWINRFLGTDIPETEMISILKSLGFTVENGVITAPSFRIDIEHKADIAEEIARIYGYNKIPSTLMSGATRGKLNDKQKFRKLTDETLLALGLSEIMTYSFISPKYYDKIGLAADSPLRKSVTIENPLGEDTSVMRTTALPSMLEILSKNYNYRNMSAALYEIATEYTPQGDNELPIEQDKIVLGLYGGDYDFYALKGMVEALFDKLNLPEPDVAAVSADPTFHPGRCAGLYLDGVCVGLLGEFHPMVLDNYEIGIKAYGAALDFELLFAKRNAEKQYKSLPKYPATTRDLALLCSRDLPVLTLQKTIKAAAGKLLEDLTLFDIYTGQQIGGDKKSVAFNLTLRSREETLTVEQADAVMKKILKAFAVLDVTIR